MNSWLLFWYWHPSQLGRCLKYAKCEICCQWITLELLQFHWSLVGCPLPKLKGLSAIAQLVIKSMLIGQFSKCLILQACLHSLVYFLTYFFVYRPWENWFKSKELLAHTRCLEVSSSIWENRNNTFLHLDVSSSFKHLLHIFLWNFLSPLKSLVDHSITRVSWHTHMKSKFRRFHHPHLSISRTGTWKWVCVQARKWCVHHFLITGDEGGEKRPLMWMIRWVILGLVTSWASKNLPRKKSFKGFLSSTSHFFSSFLVSTQDSTPGVPGVSPDFPGAFMLKPSVPVFWKLQSFVLSEFMENLQLFEDSRVLRLVKQQKETTVAKMKFKPSNVKLNKSQTIWNFHSSALPYWQPLPPFSC